MPANRAPGILIFRCDDYRGDLGLIGQVDQALVAMFVQRNLPLVFGVIPADLGGHPEALATLRPAVAAGTVEVAQHGWDHRAQADLLARQGIKSEYLGRPYDEQLQRIGQGKHLLEMWFHIPVCTFIPPWDSYDENTLRACTELGFAALSADLYSPADSKATRPVLLPSTLKLSSLEALIERWSRQVEPGSIAVIEFHAYEFVESGSSLGYFSLGKLEQLLDRIVASPHLRVYSLHQAVQQLGPAVDNQRYRLAQQAERSAQEIYQTTWRNRLGNWLHIPNRVQPEVYERVLVYRRQVIFQQLLYHSPTLIAFLFLTVALLIAYLFTARARVGN
jgi:hypothetical protein